MKNITLRPVHFIFLLFLFTGCTREVDVLPTIAPTGEVPTVTSVPTATIVLVPSIDADAVQRHIDHGDRLTNQEKYEEAIQAYSLAIELQPDNVLALIKRGQAIIKTEQGSWGAGEALRDFNAALKLAPENIEALFGRGQSLARIGSNEESVAIFSDLLDRDPTFTEAYYARGHSYHQLGNWTLAYSRLSHKTEP